MPKVSIYTQVFNAGAFLRPCIDSVLSQTHQDWEHIIADAGSTDGSVEILREYAASDSRVKFIQLPENRWSQYEMTEQYATGEYYASLDHDDWWDPEFLERLLWFLQKNDLDIAFTGVIQFFQENQRYRTMRKLEKPVVLTIEQFAKNYEKYGSFANARWASIMPTKKYLSMKCEYEEFLQLGITWRSDTILMLKYLSAMEKIGIDNSSMQYYRIFEGSQVRQINPTRLKSEVKYYKAVRDFLERFGAWTPSKQNWSKKLFLSEIENAMEHLNYFTMPFSEKLQFCSDFLKHPLTLDAMTSKENSSLKEAFLLEVEKLVASAASDRDIPFEALETFQKALQSFAPSSAGAVVPGQFSIFAKESGLADALLKDDRERMQELLLDLVDSGKYEDEYNLGEMLLGIIPKGSPLYGVQDTDIFKAYPQICRFILGGANLTALDLMTGLLLEGGAVQSKSAFLQTYLNLAAQMGQASAFLFGKIRLAEHCLQGGQAQLCEEILRELKEMGAGEHEEVVRLEAQLRSAEKGALA